ncbi:starch-binding protein SusD [Pedobacter glucosidilyticus]|nr:RagB/SusD family nutrient uptake outer membrane protein [Pedobacter glucosidilyticus]KHJ38992.1 starch-binding protein SusD [Pedobacter glucosidilyticus]
MKIFKYTVSIALLSLFSVSCQKDVSLEPISFQPTNFTTAAQIESQLIGVYNVLNASQMYGEGLWGYFTAGTDESFRSGSIPATILTQHYNIEASENNLYIYWRNLYMGIERANVLLDGIDKIQMNETRRNAIKGQAKFLRAYYFYLLVNHFGDVPLKTTLTTELGTNFNLPRNSAKEVYEFVIKEMEEAHELAESMTSVRTTSVVTKSAIEAMLARVCLSMAGNPVNDDTKYAKALFWAKKTIDANIHSLYSSPHPLYAETPAYARVFINNMQNNVNDAAVGEGIWDAAFLSKSNATGAYAGLGFLVTQTLGSIMGVFSPDASARATIGFSSATYRALPKLFNLYAPGDLRRDWAIAPFLYKNTTNTRFFSLQVNITGGGGTGARATAFTSNTGAITSIVIDNPGTGYTTAPAITFTAFRTDNNTTSPITGTNVATATAVVSGGRLTAINITRAGNGYPTVYDRAAAKWRREYEVNLPEIRLRNNTACNFPIIRFADVLLMAAEADLRVNGTPSAEAVEYYNRVRRRAFGLNPLSAQPTVDVTTFTMEDMYDERSRELCFEGVRRADLIRWGIMTREMTEVVQDNALRSPTGYAVASSLAANNFLTNPAKYVLFPIPARERELNLALSQNLGW